MNETNRDNIIDLMNENHRLRQLVVRAADFCDYATGETLEYGIRCCCATRDFDDHKPSCEYGKIAKEFRK